MIIETLKKSRIFSPLSEEVLEEISPYFEPLDFKKGDFIFNEGDESKWLFLVSRSRVKMAKHSLTGKDVILEIKSPGGMFCCAAVLDSRPYPESAQAMGDVSVIRINRQNLTKIIDKYPGLKIEFAKYASDKLSDAYENFKHIATEKVEKRIAYVLLKISHKSDQDKGGFTKTDFPVKRQEIAEMVGASVETCIRTIKVFEKEGMVQSSGRKLLVNVEALQTFLNDQENG